MDWTKILAVGAVLGLGYWYVKKEADKQASSQSNPAPPGVILGQQAVR